MNTTYNTLIVLMNNVVKSDFITKRGSTYNTVHYMNVCSSEHKKWQNLLFHILFRVTDKVVVEHVPTYSRYQRTYDEKNPLTTILTKQVYDGIYFYTKARHNTIANNHTFLPYSCFFSYGHNWLFCSWIPRLLSFNKLCRSVLMTIVIKNPKMNIINGHASNTVNVTRYRCP